MGLSRRDVLDLRLRRSGDLPAELEYQQFGPRRYLHHDRHRRGLLDSLPLLRLLANYRLADGTSRLQPISCIRHRLNRRDIDRDDQRRIDHRDQKWPLGDGLGRAFNVWPRLGSKGFGFKGC